MSLDLNIPSHVFKVNTENTQGIENLCIEVVEGSGVVFVMMINATENLLGMVASNITSNIGNYPCLMDSIFPLKFNWSLYYVRIQPYEISSFLSYKLSYYSLETNSIKRVLYTSSLVSANKNILGYSFPG